MEATSSRRSRKPFSDCTNTIDAVNPSQSSSTSTKNSSSIIKPRNLISANRKTSVATKPSKTQADLATGSRTTPSGKCDDKLTKPSAVLVPSVSTPSRTPKPYSHEGTDWHESLEPSSVYVRRRSAVKIQRKEKEIVVPKSCFPAIKTRSKRDKMNEDGVSSLSKSCPAPNRKRKRQTTPEVHALPQDFIEQQKAYFAEVDAFELAEEEVNALSE